VGALLDAGAVASHAQQHGLTALALAAVGHGHESVVRLLLSCVGDSDELLADGRIEAMNLAAQHGHIALAR